MFYVLYTPLTISIQRSARTPTMPISKRVIHPFLRDPYWRINLTVPLVALFAVLALLAIAVWPLRRARVVLYPQTEADRKRYAPLTVRVAYGILCALGIVVALACVSSACFIIYGLWGWSVGGVGMRVKGDAMTFAAVVYMTIAFASVVMVGGMLPAYGVYRYGLSTRT